MKHEIINLPISYRGKLENNNYTPTLTTYILDNFSDLNSKRKRPIVIICPGGGYSHLSNREAEPVAIRMNALGFHAAVLRYSLAPVDFPASLCDAAEAVYYTRTHASEWNVDSDKIIMCGFSAGAHVAASLGCYWNGLCANSTPSICESENFKKNNDTGISNLFDPHLPLLPQFIKYSSEEIKPNALLLGYPVLTAGEFCHDDSIKNVLGKKCLNHREWVNLEDKVSVDVPPVFMWHTNMDTAVPAENSMSFAAALRRSNVPFEYHLFARGVHGLALATAETCKPDGNTVEKECAVWPELFKEWIFGLWN